MILLFPALVAACVGAFFFATGNPVSAAVCWGVGGAYVGYLLASPGEDS